MSLSPELVAKRENFYNYKNIEFKDFLPADRYWVVWWYSGIEKNIRSNTQPLVTVVLRELYPDTNKISKSYTLRKIAISYLDRIQIGTICKNNFAIGQIPFERRTFTFNVNSQTYDLTSVAQCLSQNIALPFPKDLYAMNHPVDRNYLIRFDLGNDGGKLVIPCIDYFSMAYGSSDLRRILTTYMWDQGLDTAKERLIKPIKTNEGHNQVIVRIPDGLYVSDVPLLGYLKKSGYAVNKAKYIKSQIQIAFEKSNKSMFIKVEPWFTGETTIEIDGFSFGNSFLGLRIINISHPKTDLKFFYESDEGVKSVNGLGSVNVLNPRPSKVLTNPPEQPTLTSTQSPDVGAPTLKIKSPKSLFLGHIIDPKPIRTDRLVSTISKLPPVPVELDEFSSGDPSGNGQNIGKVTLQSKPLVESKGVLYDMWNAFNFIKNNYSNVIDTVEWLRNDYTFSTDNKIEIIDLPDFNGFDLESKSKELNTVPKNDAESDSLSILMIKKWLLMNESSKEKRGVFIIKIKTSRSLFYVAEVQRKIKVNANKEEEILGLAFRINPQLKFDEAIQNIMKLIVLRMGHMNKVITELNGDAISFKHCEAEGLSVASESTCINILNKMDAQLKLKPVKNKKET